MEWRKIADYFRHYFWCCYAFFDASCNEMHEKLMAFVMKIDTIFDNFKSTFHLYHSFIMPHAFGYRAHTRTLFKKAFKTNGRCPTTTYLRTFKRGDYVDIKVDSSIHKGMPFKYYHGRTGVVFNVTKRAIGVRVNKEVRSKKIT